jgi:site-specific recombinase XerD
LATTFRKFPLLRKTHVKNLPAIRPSQQGIAWLDALRRHGRSLKTVSTYATAIISLQRFLNDRDIADARRVRRSDLEAWQQTLDDRTPATREQFTRIIGYWFKWLVKRGTLFQNPAAELKKTKLPQRLVRCPSELEMKRLLRSVQGSSPRAQRDRALLETAYGTGARLGELARLQASSLRLDTGLVLLHGKGDRDRMAPLTQLACKSLGRYLVRARGRLLGSHPDHGALFIGSRGGRPLSSIGIARALGSAARRIGLKLTPHDVRRAFATHLLRGGANPAQVKELLGHQTYRHLARYLQTCPPRLKSNDRRKSP